MNLFLNFYLLLTYPIHPIVRFPGYRLGIDYKIQG